MKIVLAGGSGQVGTMLARAFHASGDETVVLSRHPQEHAWRTVLWDGKTPGEWQRELEGADAVVNLAGRSVNCRYTPANRREIIASRVDSVRAVGQAIQTARKPPPVWLQASTATIYAHTFGAPNDDVTGVVGGHEPDAPETWRFSIGVAQSWEAALAEADVPQTRKVALRSAMTMSPDAGGVFDVLLTLVRRGLGGAAGSGRQYVSWIHERDFVRAIRFLLAHEEIGGPVALASPHPLPQSEFMRILREAAGVSLALPAPRWLLEIGAFFMGTETELILKSRRVVPTRLTAAGFTFDFPEWKPAAHDLIARLDRR